MAEAPSGDHRVMLGAEKDYDTRICTDDLRCANVTPHVAQNNTPPWLSSQPCITQAQ